MKHLFCTSAALLALSFSLFGAKKQIIAHYMGCFPVGNGPIHHHMSNIHKEVRHDNDSFVNALGGRIVNFALSPQNRVLSSSESAELEIKRAMRGGIDGFAVDAWAGGNESKKVMDNLFAAAERLKVPFYITVCLDPGCHARNPKEPGNQIPEYTKTVKYLLEKHGKSPNLLRRNEKPVIVGYNSEGIDTTPDIKTMREGLAKWQKIRDAYTQLEKEVGQKLYIHYDFDNDEKTEAKAEFIGKHYDAVGGFLGGNQNWRFNDTLIHAIQKGGAEWSMPMWFQYNNKFGSLMSGKGTEILRKNWEQARKTNSTFIQFVTWNDYGEDTVLAPGYSTNYTILNLNKYFIDWWKNGKEPKIDEDVIHLIFKRNKPGSQTYPFCERRNSPSVLEVVTLLTKPGKIDVENYGSYEVPAGLFIKQFELKVGKISAKLKRVFFQSTDIEVTAPEIVSDRPFREDNAMVCFSSNFEAEWKKDFPKDKPFYYSEYGDLDNDGIPNWFEMYWFGKFPLMETATAADPNADPDNDGLTNFQEWKNQSNPLVSTRIYKVGDVWNMDDIHNRGISFNPDLDFSETPVWFYFYKHGEVGKIAHDGNYVRSPDSGSKVPYAGLMCHFSPHKDAKYKYIYGWICRKKKSDGSFLIRIVPRKQAMQLFAWKSPVSGSVTLNVAGTIQPGPVGNLFEIRKNQEVLFTKRVWKKDEMEKFQFENHKINVKKGDMIYFIADCLENGASVEFFILNLKLNSLEVK